MRTKQDIEKKILDLNIKLTKWKSVDPDDADADEVLYMKDTIKAKIEALRWVIMEYTDL